MLKEISFEIIRKCPNNCLHCSSLSNINCTEEVPLEIFMDVINKGIELGLQSVCLSGGEPFIHKDIVKIIEFLNEKKLKTIIYTSGIILDDFGNLAAFDEEIIKRVSGKVEKLIFNMEASKEDTYDKIMGTIGCFNYFLRSVKIVRENNISLEAHFVPMKLNINEIDTTMELAMELGIQRVSFLRLVNHGRAEENIDVIGLSEKETFDVKRKLNEIEKKYGNAIRIGVPLTEDICRHNCEAANGKLNIKYDGTVYPCEVFKNNKLNKIGNNMPESIYNKSLLEIYNFSEYLINVRNEINIFSDNQGTENCIGQYFMLKNSK